MMELVWLWFVPNAATKFWVAALVFVHVGGSGRRASAILLLGLCVVSVAD
jgi:hypothetical protein